MNDRAIFQPVVVLALLTLLVLLLIPIRRFRAGSQGKVNADDFKLGESSRVPPEVALPNRAWMNLLEAPLLFYVAAIVQFSISAVDQYALTLAWTYVGLRIVHTLIHVTYNKVIHRLIAFAASNFVLVLIWIKTANAVFAPG